MHRPPCAQVGDVAGDFPQRICVLTSHSGAERCAILIHFLQRVRYPLALPLGRHLLLTLHRLLRRVRGGPTARVPLLVVPAAAWTADCEQLGPCGAVRAASGV